MQYTLQQIQMADDAIRYSRVFLAVKKLAFRDSKIINIIIIITIIIIILLPLFIIILIFITIRPYMYMENAKNVS